MQKKGQALVEFIIILPIVLLLFLGIIDVGRIMYGKIILEDKMSEVITYYEKGLTNEEIKEALSLENTELEIKEENNNLNFALSEEIDILTPGLNVILDNPYVIKSFRSMINNA